MAHLKEQSNFAEENKFRKSDYVRGQKVSDIGSEEYEDGMIYDIDDKKKTYGIVKPTPTDIKHPFHYHQILQDGATAHTPSPDIKEIVKDMQEEFNTKG